jgi:hypothetical protein
MGPPSVVRPRVVRSPLGGAGIGKLLTGLGVVHRPSAGTTALIRGSFVAWPEGPVASPDWRLRRKHWWLRRAGDLVGRPGGFVGLAAWSEGLAASSDWRLGRRSLAGLARLATRPEVPVASPDWRLRRKHWRLHWTGDSAGSTGGFTGLAARLEAVVSSVARPEKPAGSARGHQRFGRGRCQPHRNRGGFTLKHWRRPSADGQRAPPASAKHLGRPSVQLWSYLHGLGVRRPGTQSLDDEPPAACCAWVPGVRARRFPGVTEASLLPLSWPAQRPHLLSTP